MNEELPNGWVWTILGEIVSEKITKGSTPTSYGFSYVNKGIKFIKTENINENGIIQEKTDFIDKDTNNFLKRSQLKNKDILFSIAGTIGRIGIIEEKDLPANTNQALAIIRCSWNLVENKYIFYLLKSSFIQNQASEFIVGVGRANVSLTDLGHIPVPLPPLAEQQRIVNKIEELFTNLDKGIEALEEVKSKLKIYRQAILKHAMEGKLTEKWREENKNFNKNDLNLHGIKNINNSEEIYYSTELKIEDIPSNWSLVKVENVSDFFKGQRSPKNYYVEESHPDAKPYIRIQDFRTKKVSMYTKADWCLKCQKIDTLLATDGAIGSSDFGWEGVLTHHILCIRPKIDLILPYYLFLFVSINKNYFYNNKTGVCSPTLRQQYVRKLIIPLPPLEEQQEIVNRIEKLFSVADHIEETVNSKLQESKILRQSILKKAFEGKLVPQNPNDEPAEILLEKIKMEKSNKGKLLQEKLVQ